MTTFIVVLSEFCCTSVLKKEVVADFLKAFEGFVSNNNNEKYWCILLWLVLFGFYFSTCQWTESLFSSQFSLWCKWGSQMLHSDSGLTWPKLLLFLYSPKQRILSGSRMHTTQSASWGSNMLLVLSGCELQASSEINLKMELFWSRCNWCFSSVC